jgi:hypothetical protein
MTTFDDSIGPFVIQTPVSFLASGDNIIIVGSIGTLIRVLQFFWVIASTTTLIYKSGATALTGPLVFGTNAAQVQDFIQLPLTCNNGDNFIVNSTAAVQVGGTIWYAQAPAVS